MSLEGAAPAGGAVSAGGDSSANIPYPCWEYLECGGEVPQSRSGHTCALYRNRYLYIFVDGANCFDDLYMLDLDLRQWRRIEASGDRPSGRASHSVVTDDIAGVMYIFGGSGSHFGYTNRRDLCEFCFDTESWRLLSNPQEDVPSARYGQSLVAYKLGLYVWGGTHGTNYPTDMHRFDLCSKQWECVVTTGDLPCGRYRHQAMVKDDFMYIVGGSGINKYGDVYTFHFGTNNWTKLQCTGTDLSNGRYAHSAVLRDGHMYLYGGSDGIRHDDLQQLDLDTRVWSRVHVHGACPPCRDFHAAVLRRGSMVIFGGSNENKRHNDAYEFHMTPKLPFCTLQSDFEQLLEQAQQDDATQSTCDVFLASGCGPTSRGVYCHSRLLQVRCPRLLELITLADAARTDAGSDEGKNKALESMPLVALWAQSPPPHSPVINVDEGDSALKAYIPVGTTPLDLRKCASRVAAGMNSIPIDMPQDVLMYFIRFLYTDLASLARLDAEKLYTLLTAAKLFEAPRLAALCERQLKLTLHLDNVMLLLRATARDAPLTQTVQDACKHFFLVNYNQCTELEECENLDPKLLCGLMRLQKFRNVSSSAAPAAAGVASGPGSFLSTTIGVPTSPAPAAVAAVTRVDSSKTTKQDTTSSTPGTLPSVGDGVVPPETLGRDLRRLLDLDIEPDFLVEVQGETIKTHRFVLIARSRYFGSCLLTSGMSESQEGKLVIPSSSPMTAEAFRAFLLFLYAGDEIRPTLEPHTAMYLVDAASFYGLTNLRLKHFCELNVRDSFDEAHVLQLFEASSRLNVDVVRAMALDFIVANFNTVCRQPALELLDKPLLIEIIKGLAEKLPQRAGGGDGRSLLEPRAAS
eukprot:CAMPEP_0206586266 /NCGR_PEP_ID=MMETSP0325_2-20121206/36914_1 /ASSEMBLY_ACC=CAM_ASM_000347 /TAXON_ID=2866 /ORGANISM="Crypthecodinium cohnii, Strain Seligo" /LENGTH=857 /DNA_ID=CAMNT_0054093979 /DNA_START=48 /DNA_END=2621 /DNA_ORIENTATION=+